MLLECEQPCKLTEGETDSKFHHANTDTDTVSYDGLLEQAMWVETSFGK